MTPKQREQFNLMRSTLIRIASKYQTTQQLRRGSQDQYGIDYEEALEYSYENIQADAKRVTKGVRAV